MQINREVLRHGAVIARYGAVALVGASIGFGVSHFRSKKQLDILQQSQTRLQKQIRELGESLKNSSDALAQLDAEIRNASADKVPLNPNQLRFVEEVNTPLSQLNTDDNPMYVLKPAKVVSIFPEERTEPWDQEKENAARERHQGRPYIISVDEFQENELDLAQQTITFYEGDRVLVDQEDVPIYNYGNVVGELLFGHGSQDPNIVYVRNPRGKIEYEILRDHGSYAIVVLGQDIEDEAEEADLKHGNNYRFRRDD